MGLAEPRPPPGSLNIGRSLTPSGPALLAQQVDSQKKRKNTYGGGFRCFSPGLPPRTGRSANMTTASKAHTRLISKGEVLGRTGLSYPTIWHGCKTASFRAAETSAAGLCGWHLRLTPGFSICLCATKGRQRSGGVIPCPETPRALSSGGDRSEGRGSDRAWQARSFSSKKSRRSASVHSGHRHGARFFARA